ncbi:MAG: hypothetical protein WA964_13580 [Ilumatobacter sp.]|uniref:hypothetical protein n=1 Tax=Ilumatobacter sp. TaxID=1967498 RepID=UPI003C7195EF
MGAALVGLLVVGVGVCLVVRNRRMRVVVYGAGMAMTFVVSLLIGESVGTVLSILE